MTDFVDIWYDYRCWSKIFLGIIHTPANDLEVKATDLEILCYFFIIFGMIIDIDWKLYSALSPHLLMT